MKNKIKNTAYIAFSVILLGLIPVFFAKERPIEVNLPELNEQEITAIEEAAQKKAHVSAERAFVRRSVACQSNDDCVIVDKDPCGCLVGPSGVTAINVNYMLEFSEKQSKQLKACPDKEPSQLRECSPSAHAVCRNKTCKIVY